MIDAGIIPLNIVLAVCQTSAGGSSTGHSNFLQAEELCAFPGHQQRLFHISKQLELPLRCQHLPNILEHREQSAGRHRVEQFVDLVIARYLMHPNIESYLVCSRLQVNTKNPPSKAKRKIGGMPDMILAPVTRTSP